MQHRQKWFGVYRHYYCVLNLLKIRKVLQRSFMVIVHDAYKFSGRSTISYGAVIRTLGDVIGCCVRFDAGTMAWFTIMVLTKEQHIVRVITGTYFPGISML
jgi:hypothetical protein